MAQLRYSAQREQLVQAARRLDQTGVLSHSGHGNMSVRLPEPGLLLLTAVSHLTHLTPEQSVVVTFDGDVVEGTLDPTTREIVGMHSCVYRERNDIHSVIHTHSPRATQMNMSIEKALPDFLNESERARENQLFWTFLVILPSL